jgi:mRNA interferase RelE/StbE
MEFEITRKFGKQVDKCNDRKIRKNLSMVIISIQKAQNLKEINNLKKLKGHRNIYRIRMGDFRIGIVLRNKKVILATFDHRSDIYKYFP